MRDGNYQKGGRQDEPTEVVSLPMRDGNQQRLANCYEVYFVVSLPMRDGNSDNEASREPYPGLLAYL